MRYIKSVIILVAIGAVFYYTNPNMSDFGKYYENKKVAASQKGVPEVLGKFAKAVAESSADAIVKLGFKRSDKFLFSVYTLGPDKKPTERYLGMLKMAFIELK
jgi:hypothetical protein